MEEYLSKHKFGLAVLGGFIMGIAVAIGMPAIIKQDFFTFLITIIVMGLGSFITKYSSELQNKSTSIELNRN